VLRDGEHVPGVLGPSSVPFSVPNLDSEGVEAVPGSGIESEIEARGVGKRWECCGARLSVQDALGPTDRVLVVPRGFWVMRRPSFAAS
jgi:hypothetical protein